MMMMMKRTHLPRHLHLQNSSRSSWARAPEMLQGFCSFILQYNFTRIYSRYLFKKCWKVLLHVFLDQDIPQYRERKTRLFPLFFFFLYDPYCFGALSFTFILIEQVGAMQTPFSPGETFGWLGVGMGKFDTSLVRWGWFFRRLWWFFRWRLSCWTFGHICAKVLAKGGSWRDGARLSGKQDSLNSKISRFKDIWVGHSKTFKRTVL